jgi:GDP/UDP-N,N'-diacetylbacillosamine 2-epimerase (hydrolysing)
MIKKSICVVTGSRAEYDQLFWLLKLLKKDKKIILNLIVSGTHLEKKYGFTYSKIKEDGFEKNIKIKLFIKGDKASDINDLVSLGVRLFSKRLKKIKPDLVILLGDRYEVFSAAIAASFLNIPIAHLNGGEITAGAFDEWIRHSITKMSSLHFVANKKYKKRVIQLGENPKKVFNVGGLSSDNVYKTNLISKNEIEKLFNFQFKKRNLLITYHPVTLENNSAKKDFAEILKTIKSQKDTLAIFTFPNADTNNKIIIKMIKKFSKNNKNAVFFTSLGRVKYLSILKNCDAIIGNSSSGLLEAPYLEVGTVNIGDRQLGREKTKNIIDCKPINKEILKALKKIFTNKNRNKHIQLKKHYGEGNTAENIYKILKKKLSDIQIKKVFYDL